MSEENVALVRDLLEWFRRREHERAFEVYAPNIEWDATGVAETIPDLAGVYRGHDGVRTYWRRWLQAWKDIDFEVEDILDGGDEIVALIRHQRMWGRTTEIPVDFPPYALVFTVRDGKVTRWRSFPNRAEALAAAGIAT